MFIATWPRWAVVLVATGLLLALEIPWLRVITFAVLLYLGFARRTFRMWLDRELRALRGLTLNKRF
jgi:hypothetical protein